MTQRIRHVFHLYHPAVILLYAVSVLGLTMSTLQPVYLAISVVTAVIYGRYLIGWQRFRKILLFAAIPALMIALVNPLFSSGGATILFYLGRFSVTREAIFYGLAAGAMLLAVLLWFACWQKLINQEKFMYLFGRVFPTLALMLSMIFRLLPVTRSKALQISYARKAALPQVSGVRQRLKRQAAAISILMSWTMEDSIETADTMRARGYGTGRRTSYQIFSWHTRDTVMAVCLMLLLLADARGVWLHVFQYYPRLDGDLTAWPQLALYPVHAVLLGLPLILEAWEAIRWK